MKAKSGEVLISGEVAACLKVEEKERKGKKCKMQASQNQS